MEIATHECEKKKLNFKSFSLSFLETGRNAEIAGWERVLENKLTLQPGDLQAEPILL